MKKESGATLARALGLRDSLAIVIGSMIGTGIFLKTASMTQALGSPLWVLMAWLIAGILSLLGAMTYAELGALFPEAGGGYVYIREAYGRLPAFLAGWVSFWIVFPGSIAAYAVATATFLGGALPVQHWSVPISISLIVGFAALNSLAVSFGGLVQSLITGIKVALILLLTISIFRFTPEPMPLGLTGFSSLSVGWGAFGIATLSALWAFDGWEAISRVAGEVYQPQRTLPFSLVIGIFTVIGLYAFLNIAYFWALPIGEITNANSGAYPSALPVATKAVMGFLPDTGVQVLSAVFVISTIGAMNGSILTSARVPFAMAQDGLFFSYLSKVSPRTRVPVRAIWIQAGVASVLALSGTFDQLTNYVVFSAWIFYGLTGLTLFVFRRTRPNRPVGFRVPGYPFVPALFVFMAAVLVITTVLHSPMESVIGLGLILAGVPVYYALFSKSRQQQD
ncbi:MAG: APC family permease [Bdellovibrionales bacterium]